LCVRRLQQIFREVVIRRGYASENPAVKGELVGASLKPLALSRVKVSGTAQEVGLYKTSTETAFETLYSGKADPVTGHRQIWWNTASLRKIVLATANPNLLWIADRLMAADTVRFRRAKNPLHMLLKEIWDTAQVQGKETTLGWTLPAVDDLAGMVEAICVRAPKLR
jgi:hypothetical protein